MMLNTEAGYVMQMLESGFEPIWHHKCSSK